MRQINNEELTQSHYFEDMAAHTIGKPDKIMVAKFLAYMLLSAYLRRNGIKKAYIDSVVHTYLESMRFEEWNL